MLETAFLYRGILIIHRFVYKQLTYATEQMRLKMNKTTVVKNVAKQKKIKKKLITVLIQHSNNKVTVIQISCFRYHDLM